MRDPAKVEEMVALVKSHIASKSTSSVDLKDPVVNQTPSQQEVRPLAPIRLDSFGSSSRPADNFLSLDLYDLMGDKDKFDQLPCLKISNDWKHNLGKLNHNKGQLHSKPDHIPLEAVTSPIMRDDFENYGLKFEYLILKFKVKVDDQENLPSVQVFWMALETGELGGMTPFYFNMLWNNCHSVEGEKSSYPDLMEILYHTEKDPIAALKTLLANGEFKARNLENNSKEYHIQLTIENS